MRKFKRMIAAIAAMTMVFGGVNAVGNAAEATLKGDADLNGTVDLADLTTIAKYNLSSSSYPLANETAFANADVNDDGKVDGIDVSMLIETQLGKEYISAADTGKTVELTANLNTVSIQASKPSSKFENSQTELALSLLKNSLSEEENTLISGYSAAQALAMTANGANGNTLKEMMDVIGGGTDISSFNDDMAGYNSGQPKDEECRLLTANSIWYKNDESRFRVNKDFLVKNKSVYDAQIFAAPMDNDTLDDINSWVNEHTDKMIPSILDELGDEVIMALVNAVTFDAKWTNPFDESYKSRGFFTAADGSGQDADVLSEEGGGYYLKDEEARGILKYYKGGRYAFAAILPNEGTSANDYAKGLTAEKFSGLINSSEYKSLEVQMPKFSADYEGHWVDTLKAMGIKDAFDGAAADFSKMGRSARSNICIGDVIQKTHIDVDEEGTRAAAATAVIATDCCARLYDEKLTFDRPFVYAIVDTQTNIPIFIGTLNTLK